MAALGAPGPLGGALGEALTIPRAGRSLPGNHEAAVRIRRIPTGAYISSSPCFASSRDGTILAWGGDGLHVTDLEGNPRPGWPRSGLRFFASSPSVMDVPGRSLLFCGNDDDRLYGWNLDGSDLPGFPVQTGGDVYSAPALADLDGDGAVWILFGSDDGGVHVVDSQGRPRPGWPRWTGHFVAASPCLVDLDGCGHPEVVAGSWDGRLYAWRADGSPLPGWPVELGSYLWSSPVAADLDAGPLTDRMQLLLSDLSRSVDGDLERVVGCAGELSHNTRQIGTAAEDQTESVSKATTYVEQMSANIDTVSQSAAAAQGSASAVRESAEETLRLTGDLFLTEDRGMQTLKGISDPFRVFRVMGRSAIRSRLDGVPDRLLSPLVGRERELEALVAERVGADTVDATHVGDVARTAELLEEPPRAEFAVRGLVIRHQVRGLGRDRVVHNDDHDALSFRFLDDRVERLGIAGVQDDGVHAL